MVRYPWRQVAVLNYGQTIFEGMKATRGNGSVMLFRPEQNHRRFNQSAARICMPDVPEEILWEGYRP